MFIRRFLLKGPFSPCSSPSAGAATAIGAGTTHAWADIYLPGASWVDYDPTNGTISSGDLIRVAVTRDIGQAIPIAGSFVGRPGDFLGMTVDVAVGSENSAHDDGVACRSWLPSRRGSSKPTARHKHRLWRSKGAP
jgi:hypothetical protein